MWLTTFHSEFDQVVGAAANPVPGSRFKTPEEQAWYDECVAAYQALLNRNSRVRTRKIAKATRVKNSQKNSRKRLAQPMRKSRKKGTATQRLGLKRL
ncbi:hypothetical protein LLE49_00755 [Alicyclobacillus tolerans]|uniref:hypothetical protein n=1 Tax=Alicyclobacillus tolerans TaxID=90970 RepID=UPI001F46384C|nr:hypothetical protein [Alicyclobacillus tolerans]MCF8563274.1 hypothetical protein [Alicyclobacillus tolerans]